MPTLRLQLHYLDMPVPQRAHPKDIGLDLTVMAVEPYHERLFFIDTGVSVEPQEGYYVEVVARSSLSKTDFILANSVGIIDPDYRGRIRLALRYLGEESGTDAAAELIGCRVAQLILRCREEVVVEVVSELRETVRSSRGFGSSGS
jgi:dUTP pyrophosphatase